MNANLDECKKPSERFKNICNIQSHYKSLLFIAILLLLFYSFTVKYVNDNSFDDLIFTQRWLPSSCIEYEEKNLSSHQCVLPADYDVWAIHGLWPNRKEGFGPFFCNKSNEFDINKLKPILPDLRIFWPDIENKGEQSFWKHEWTKHGTCAAQLDSLNTELKYFNQTLELFNQFNINNFFHQYDLYPSDDNGINVSYILDLVKTNFGKNSYIHCITEVNTKKSFLSEIRFCLNKNLELIDCEIVNNKFYKRNLQKKITNCPQDSLIFLPATVDF